MKYPLRHLLGTTAVAALLMVAACDQNEEEQAENTSQEIPAPDNTVPMTSEQGAATGGMQTSDSTLPQSEMPGSNAPQSDMPATDLDDTSMGQETAAEGTDAETIAGTGNAANDCAAAASADGLGTWVGQPYDEAEEAIEAREGIETVRVIRPGDMVTKDFREGRLNVELDDQGEITKIYCG